MSDLIKKLFCLYFKKNKKTRFFPIQNFFQKVIIIGSEIIIDSIDEKNVLQKIILDILKYKKKEKRK